MVRVSSGVQLFVGVFWAKSTKWGVLLQCPVCFCLFAFLLHSYTSSVCADFLTIFIASCCTGVELQIQFGLNLVNLILKCGNLCLILNYFKERLSEF